MATSIKKTVKAYNGQVIDDYFVGQDVQFIVSPVNKSVYSCILNLTDITKGSNSNKYYKIQCVENLKKDTFILIRYGRIGDSGVVKVERLDRYVCINKFELQFKTKTGNKWGQPFFPQPGKYFLADLDSEIDPIVDTPALRSQSDIDEEKVDPKLNEFIKLITNQSFMKNTLTQFNIDVQKLPLGKISHAQVQKAYSILSQIEKQIALPYDILPSQKVIDELEKLSSSFYTLFPCNVGRAKPPLIDSKKMVSEKANLLDNISQMVTGVNILSATQKNKISTICQELNTEFKLLDSNTQIYKLLTEYLHVSNTEFHKFKFDITAIFELDRPKERDAYEKYSSNLGNKNLLFHGTRISNLMGILKNGLVVDPSKLGINVFTTGKMFGMGLYFANCCSKSLQYCAADQSGGNACLFVSEVALGKVMPLKDGNYSLTAKTLPKDYHSVQGLGKNSYNKIYMYNDIYIPRGQPITLAKENNLYYDEFIIYHEEQISLKYIIQLKIKS